MKTGVEYSLWLTIYIYMACCTWEIRKYILIINVYLIYTDIHFLFIYILNGEQIY